MTYNSITFRGEYSSSITSLSKQHFQKKLLCQSIVSKTLKNILLNEIHQSILSGSGTFYFVFLSFTRKKNKRESLFSINGYWSYKSSKGIMSKEFLVFIVTRRFPV